MRAVAGVGAASLLVATTAEDDTGDGTDVADEAWGVSRRKYAEPPMMAAAESAPSAQR
jgi:hypothetical protein